VFRGNLVFDQVDLGVIPRCVDVRSSSSLPGWSMRPRNVYEDGHDHIVYVPPYAVMINFIGHYETQVDMFCHYGTPLNFILTCTPLLF
jgi:hypothetical protein